MDSPLFKEFKESKDKNRVIVWNHKEQENLEEVMKVLNKDDKQQKIVLENLERLTLSSHPESSYDIVASGILKECSINHTDELLSTLLKIIKPGGQLLLTDSAENITTVLKLNGFTDIKKEGNVYAGTKPNFAVGSSLKLKSKVWKIDDNIESAWNTDDNDIIDSDQLLDEDDLKKPDPKTLKVCGTTGVRKACADCSCGLAEELRGETKQEPKSSCGSCYLGDAFRCASCPYLGMPAFKPGEKVQLDLKSDI